MAVAVANGPQKHRCRIRFYRFHVGQVYLPGPIMPRRKRWRAGKLRTWQRNLRRYLTPPRFQCVQRNISRHAFEIIGKQRPDESVARNLHTTLVLELRACDFSTDAGNSALIVNNEISVTPR